MRGSDFKQLIASSIELTSKLSRLIYEVCEARLIGNLKQFNL